MWAFVFHMKPHLQILKAVGVRDVRCCSLQTVFFSLTLTPDKQQVVRDGDGSAAGFPGCRTRAAAGSGQPAGTEAPRGSPHPEGHPVAEDNAHQLPGGRVMRGEAQENPL